MREIKLIPKKKIKLKRLLKILQIIIFFEHLKKTKKILIKKQKYFK